MPTASRGHTNRTLMSAAREDTNPTTTSRDTTRWLGCQEEKLRNFHWVYIRSDHFLLRQIIVCLFSKKKKIETCDFLSRKKNWKTFLTRWLMNKTSKPCWFSSAYSRRLSTVKAMPSRGGPPPFPIRCEPTGNRWVCWDEVCGALEFPGQYVKKLIFFFSFSLFLHRESPEWTNSRSPQATHNATLCRSWVGLGEGY